ncbi:MAG: hypothetical protein ACREV1_05235, partial [Gammaproteobacteria bacterium]
GRQTRLIAMQARDRGETWSTPTVIAQTSSAADYPFLINDSQGIFLSWHSVEHDYQLIPLPSPEEKRPLSSSTPPQDDDPHPD